MASEKVIKELLKKIREEFPVEVSNPLTSTEIVVGCLFPKVVPLLHIADSFGKERIASIRSRLDKLLNGSVPDSLLPGMIYESLLEAKSSHQKKQTRRRKSGIFYTPSYITEYLVKSALNSNRAKTKNPIVFDPACGCGAFLIAAFRELRKRHPNIDPAIIATEWVQGTDIDPNAVHLARLSLFIEANLKGKKSWQALESTIRTGDSLRGGFNGERKFPVIVGNPPYRNVKRGISAELKTFLVKHYKTAKGQWDISAPFVELVLDHLLENDGACGLILPNPILLAENYQPVREIILRNCPVEFGPAGKPFPDPNVEASLVVVRKSKPPKRIFVLEARAEKKVKRKSVIKTNLIQKFPFHIFSHCADESFLEPVLSAFEANKLKPLGDFVVITRGIELGKNSEKVVALTAAGKARKIKPLLTGEDVDSYHASINHGISMSGSRDEKAKLLKDASLWSGQSQLLLRRVGKYPIAAVIEPPVLALNTLYIIRGENIDNYSTCALINSGTFRKIFFQMYAFDDKLFPYLRISQLVRMPIPQDALQDGYLRDLCKRVSRLRTFQNTRKKPLADNILEQIDKRVRDLYIRCGVTWKNIDRIFNIIKNPENGIEAGYAKKLLDSLIRFH